MFLQAEAVIVGIGTGAFYGLVGLTFTAIYNATRVINFSQGEFVMVGAVIAYWFLTKMELPFVVTLLGVAGVTSVLGLGLYWLIVRPLISRRASIVTMIIATMGSAFMMGSGAGLMTDFAFLKIDPFLGAEPLILFDTPVSRQNVILVATVTLLVASYWFLLKKTRYGMALRAVGHNKDIAALVGIPVPTMVSLAFVISASMSGICGLVIAPLTSPSFAMGLPVVIKGFVAAVIGGLGNPYAAVIGGLIVGLTSVSVTWYFSSAYSELATFVLLLAVLMFLPQGIIGGGE